MPTLFRAAADLVVTAHAAFVVFVLLGGLLVARWPRVAWLHVPAAVWGVFVELAGWVCPLTILENYLREGGESSTYQGEFIDHYLMPVLYPAHLTRARQVWLGVLAVVINLSLYTYSIRKARRSRRSGPLGTAPSS